MGTGVKARRPAQWALWALALALPATALAVTTTAFDLEGVAAFEKGRFEGAAARSDGRLVRAPRAELVELEGASVGYASAVAEDGRVFVGTGNDGAIFRVRGSKAEPHATLDAAVVTSLVFGGGALFAGAMPSPHVYRVGDDGAVKPFATLEGVEHVWALAYDARSKQLFAGTGPEGRLYAIDEAGKARLLLDVDAEHILSVAVGEGGAVYAGTSHGALLYRLAEGRVEVVHDFPGDELGALSVRGGRIAAASNKFPDLPKPPKSKDGSAKPPKLKAGEGEVWLVHESGRAESLYSLDDSHVSAVELDATGAIFAAAAGVGRVLRIEPDGEHGVWAEVEGRQVMALGLTTKTPHLLASDGAALVRMVDDARAGEWTSDALDAATRARWGELTPRSAGDVQWQTRSGNTEEPGATWSPWSRPTRGPGPVRSPAARYLQVRVKLGDDEAELRSLQALYLATNRPARSRNVHVKPPKKPDDDQFVDGVYRVPTELELEWETDNPDDDALRYELHFVRDGSGAYLPLTRADEVLSEPKYAWQTRTVPDGLYRVRVTTSDAPSNPAPYALTSTVESALIRVDNHAPRLSLKRNGKRLRGVAEDDTSRIAALTLSVDGEPFLPISPADDLLDQRREVFELPVPQLTPGSHIVAVRATDAAGNARIEQLTIVVR